MINVSPEKAAQIIELLHKNWTPHEGQVEALKPILSQGFDTAFISCGRKWGKALVNSTTYITPDGPKEIGNACIGDKLFDENGNIQTITGVYPQGVVESYRIHFNNGDYIDACAEHKWFTWTKLDRKNAARGLNHHPSVKTTKELFKTLMHGKEYNHSIPFTKPLQMPYRQLIINPYVLGAWLGDGSSSQGDICGVDMDVFKNIEKAGYIVSRRGKTIVYKIHNLTEQLKELNLIKNKHIPDTYLYADEGQRRALLQGLLDTDGHVEKKGNRVEFCNTNKNLAEGVYFLASSLGLNPSIVEKQSKKGDFKKAPQLAYIVRFHPMGQQLFRIKRKQERVREFKKTPHHTIVKIEKIENVEMTCIAVSGQSHLFLIGKSLIPTHNTEVCAYALWRHALLNPGAACYYITPEYSHGREIIWNNGRLKKFGPQQYIAQILKNESRIIFKNESFIKIVGSENWGAANGLTPDFVVYDEFKEFHSQFHIEMNPNRLVRKAPLIIIGTPPSSVSRNSEQYVEYKEECENDAKKLFIRQPSWANPHISEEWLKKEKARLFKNGDENIWFREYEAKIVPGGRSSIFPMFNRDNHVFSNRFFEQVNKRESQKIDWYFGVDPATVSVFGGLVVGIHQYTKKVYIFSELYEKDRAATSTRLIYPKINALAERWRPRKSLLSDWYKVYDEREAWFANEVMNQYGVYFSPSRKNYNNREDGINLIKDLFTYNFLHINEECINLINEIEAYHRDGDKIKKGKDHLIDTLRYILAHANYNMIEALEIKQPEPENDRYMRTIHQDLENDLDILDWTSKGDF